MTQTVQHHAFLVYRGVGLDILRQIAENAKKQKEEQNNNEIITKIGIEALKTDWLVAKKKAKSRHWNIRGGCKISVQYTDVSHWGTLL